MKVTLNQIAYVIKALNLNNVQRSILINAFANITGSNIEEMEEKLDALDKEMEAVKKQLSKIDVNTVIQELEIGDTDDIKKRNLVKLQKVEHTFIADINYGYGTADWLPTIGGSAYIVTGDGINVTYNIGIDGSVTKVKEEKNISMPAGGTDGQFLQKKGDELVWSDSTVKTASKDILGVVKIGNGIEIDANGRIYLSDFLDQVSYGVEWDTTIADSACTRIGNMNYHRTLPIQSLFKGCVAKVKNIKYYLDANDWSKKADGTPSVLDGTDGDVMVDTGAKFYYKGFHNGNKRSVRLSQIQVDSTWTEVPRMLISAYRTCLNRTDPDNIKACSVVNTTASFRGGDNNADYDTYLNTIPSRTLLGKPATNISRVQMRTYCSNASSEILCYDFYKAIYWCYVVEYANFNCKLPVNNNLISEGFHQGGLGTGLTELDWNSWISFNSYNPICPCGYTNDIGNFTGEKKITIPTIVINESTTINSIDLYVCRYRGIENIFGDIWTNLEGIVLQKPDADSKNVIYATSDNTKFNDELSNKEIRGEEINSVGYVKEFVLSDTAEIIPNSVDASNNTYKSAYHYTNNNTDKKLLLVGGGANNGSNAGLAYCDSHYGLVYANAAVGFRHIIRL